MRAMVRGRDDAVVKTAWRRRDAGRPALSRPPAAREAAEPRDDTRITPAFNAVPQRLDSWGYAVGFSAW